ncbi:MAG TPA: FxsC protein [Pyrinomonadaceae bacterium]|nr:FxsC protein [Pyrinomonadaceae bacterium]
MASWFFFSYAREDQDDYLIKFYTDLGKEIRLATQLDADEVGFLDQDSIELADRWTEKLSEALRTCKVMVSVCSPTYFGRPYCGKEFQVCLDRQASMRGPSTSMFSVIWGMPDTSVHPSMKKFQYTHRSLPPIYAKEGLRFMMKLAEYKDDYERFITRLAQAIVQAGTRHPLPNLETLSLDSVPNAFATNGQPCVTFQRNATYSYVVANHGEIVTVPAKLPRDLTKRYGQLSRDWRPFYPNCTDSIGEIAMSATAGQKMFYKELPPDVQLVPSIQKAEKDREIVILLVDPLSIRVKSYREAMEKYDKINYENSAVLVAWNSLVKTKAERMKLKKEVSQTFKFRASSTKSVYYIDSISTHRDLRNTLAKTLVKLQNSLIESSDSEQPITRPALGKKARQRGIELRRQPIVSGPGDRRR